VGKQGGAAGASTGLPMLSNPILVFNSSALLWVSVMFSKDAAVGYDDSFEIAMFTAHGCT
jgi:hypothetical protein